MLVIQLSHAFFVQRVRMVQTLPLSTNLQHCKRHDIDKPHSEVSKTFDA